MKRKSSKVRIKAPKNVIESLLSDVPAFVTNWPYVVRVSTREGLKAEIMMPRFVFKFRDTYSIDYHSDYNSHIYDGREKKGHLTLIVTLKEWQKEVEAVLELSYGGKGEFWLGKTLQDFVNRVGKSLKELAEAKGLEVPGAKASEVTLQMDFSDPMSVASFLSKSQMVHSGVHVIGDGGLLGLVGELRESIANRVLYISGVTSDGMKSFKVLVEGSRILAIEARDSGTIEALKVENDEDARKAMELASSVRGAYMVNVWVPVGGV